MSSRRCLLLPKRHRVLAWRAAFSFLAACLVVSALPLRSQTAPPEPTPPPVSPRTSVAAVRSILRAKTIGSYQLRPPLAGQLAFSTAVGFDNRPEMQNPTGAMRRVEDMGFTDLEVNKYGEAVFTTDNNLGTRALSCRSALPGNASLRDVTTIGVLQERLGPFGYWDGENYVATWDLIAADATDTIVVMRLVAFLPKPPNPSKDPNHFQPPADPPGKDAKLARFYIKRGTLAPAP